MKDFHDSRRDDRFMSPVPPEPGARSPLRIIALFLVVAVGLYGAALEGLLLPAGGPALDPEWGLVGP